MHWLTSEVAPEERDPRLELRNGLTAAQASFAAIVGQALAAKWRQEHRPATRTAAAVAIRPGHSPVREAPETHPTD